MQTVPVAPQVLNSMQVVTSRGWQQLSSEELNQMRKDGCVMMSLNTTTGAIHRGDRELHYTGNNGSQQEIKKVLCELCGANINSAYLLCSKKDNNAALIAAIDRGKGSRGLRLGTLHYLAWEGQLNLIED